MGRNCPGEFSGSGRYNSYVDKLGLVQFWPLLGSLFGPVTVKPYSILLKSVLMRKTIVINLLLILGYYLILQLLIWIAMVLR